MKIALFGYKPYEKPFFEQANQAHGYTIHYFEEHLNERTCHMAKDFNIICCFVNDSLNANVLEQLGQLGVKLIALRSAGYNHVDLHAAKTHGITVVRVPKYSPYAVAEHTVALLLTLNRKIHRAYNRVRESDFSLHGLLGFDVHGKTIGVIGTGNIGSIFARIMTGFGVKILAADPYPNQELESLGVKYVDSTELIKHSDIISLHCPLTPDTQHMINADNISKMKPGVMLINTSRGALIDTTAVIHYLKSGHIGHLALDVYEEEADLFFEDLSDKIITDDIFARLQTFPNVLITGHQAFFTDTALHNIAEVTLNNIHSYLASEKLKNEVNISLT